MTRTRTAKTANTAAAPTPAKKAAAKRTTPAKPRAPRTRAARKTAAPVLSLAKQKPAQDDPQPTATIVDHRPPLTVRRRLFVGPMGANEQAAVRAALATATTRLPIPVRSWNGSTARLADGTLITHNPGPDRTYTAHIACRHGAIHGYPIHTDTDLREARALTHACERPHGGINADQAINHGVTTTPPTISPVLELSEGIRRTATTQPLSVDDIAAGLAARTADTETPKEHPEP